MASQYSKWSWLAKDVLPIEMQYRGTTDMSQKNSLADGLRTPHAPQAAYFEEFMIILENQDGVVLRKVVIRNNRNAVLSEKYFVKAPNSPKEEPFDTELSARDWFVLEVARSRGR